MKKKINFFKACTLMVLPFLIWSSGLSCMEVAQQQNSPIASFINNPQDINDLYKLQNFKRIIDLRNSIANNNNTQNDKLDELRDNVLHHSSSFEEHKRNPENIEIHAILANTCSLSLEQDDADKIKEYLKGNSDLTKKFRKIIELFITSRSNNILYKNQQLTEDSLFNTAQPIIARQIYSLAVTMDGEQANNEGNPQQILTTISNDYNRNENKKDYLDKMLHALCVYANNLNDAYHTARCIDCKAVKHQDIDKIWDLLDQFQLLKLHDLAILCSNIDLQQTQPKTITNIIYNLPRLYDVEAILAISHLCGHDINKFYKAALLSAAMYNDSAFYGKVKKLLCDMLNSRISALKNPGDKEINNHYQTLIQTFKSTLQCIETQYDKRRTTYITKVRSIAAAALSCASFGAYHLLSDSILSSDPIRTFFK